MTVRRTTLIQGPPGPTGAIGPSGATGPAGGTGAVPFTTLIGDDPVTIPFVSRTDNTPAIQAWLTSTGNAHGGTLRLVNPCFKSRIDFSGVTRGVRIEIEGAASQLINGGELELWPGVELVGTGGGDQGVPGNFNISASLRAYNYNNAQAPDDRLSGTAAELTGPYYWVFFSGFPNGTFSDVNIGQSLTISNGVDGNGIWVVLGIDHDPNYGSTGCYAVWTGAGKPTPNQTGLHWVFGSNSGSGVSMATGSLGTAIRLSALASGTNVTNLPLTQAFKTYVRLWNASQTWLNGTYRVIGAENSNVGGFSTGALSLYLANNTALDARYVAASTLPEYGTGGTSGSPTVHYQLHFAQIRAQGGVISIRNLLLPSVQGIGIWIDGGRFLTANVTLEKVGVASAGFGTLPIVLESCFSAYLRDCQASNGLGGLGINAPSTILLTGSNPAIAPAGLVQFNTVQIAGAPIVLQNQSSPTAEQGALYFDALLTENLSGAPIVLDPRGGQCGELVIRNQSQNDASAPGATIDELVPGHNGDFQTVRILGGGTFQKKFVGSNVLTPLHLELRQQESQSTALGFVLDGVNDYVLERSNRLDAALVGASASFSPTIEQGFSAPIIDQSTWDALSGTVQVTYPSNKRGPDGLTNSTARAVPILHSTSGGYQAVNVTASVGITPSVGDYFMIGGWVQAQSTSAIMQQIPFGVAFISFSSGVAVNFAQELPLNDAQIAQTGGAWLYMSAIGKVTQSPGGSGSYVIAVGTDGTCDIALRNLWAKYIPVSSGIPEREIVRWYRHGSRNYIPGVAQGNLGIDRYQSLDWGGLATLGAPSANALQHTGGPAWRKGSGSPNGSVTGNPGDFYLNTSGGTGTTLYVKETGTGTNTGWVGK